MGRRVVDGAAGQRPDLIDDRRDDDSALRVVILTLLALDGVLCALAAALLLPSYLGSIWFPISAVGAGAVNSALVWAASQWTSSGRLMALPVLTFGLTVAVLTLGGPGDDMVLAGAGIAGFGPILLMLIGAGLPLLLMQRLV